MKTRIFTQCNNVFAAIAPQSKFIKIRRKLSKNAGRFALTELDNSGHHFAPMCINKRYTEFTKFLYGVYPYNNNHHLCKLKSLKISVDTFKSIQGKCYLLRSHQLYCLHQKKGT